ncbi:MAG: nucleoside triphosphate pyrophosphohydrolase [Nitrospirae bacterium]|nr:nucleoside triphosphate pyrophosphohydrolase [Nitrospirota bacterium]
MSRAEREGLKEELGDLLYQVFFLSQMAWEKKWFDVDDVADALSSKLVRRHPHVFKRTGLRTANQVLKQWARTKAREGNGRSVMASVPRALPALMRARRVSEKAARLGFDWKDSRGVLRKVKEEFGELEHELKHGKKRRVEEELGDLFFTLINLGRFWGVDGESALHGTVNRFVQRFQYMESEASRLGLDISRLKASEWEKLWGRAKKFSTEKVDRL